MSAEHGSGVGIARQGGVATRRIGDGDQFEIIARGNRGLMLIVRDLAVTDEAEWEPLHNRLTSINPSSASRVSGLASGKWKPSASISNTSPGRVAMLSAKLAVAVPKKCT